MSVFIHARGKVLLYWHLFKTSSIWSCNVHPDRNLPASSTTLHTYDCIYIFCFVNLPSCIPLKMSKRAVFYYIHQSYQSTRNEMNIQYLNWIRRGRGRASTESRQWRRQSYDIDNIVIPQSVAAATRPQILTYKQIITPK